MLVRREAKPAPLRVGSLRSRAPTLRRLDFAPRGVTFLLKRVPVTFLLKQYTNFNLGLTQNLPRFIVIHVPKPPDRTPNGSKCGA